MGRLSPPTIQWHAIISKKRGEPGVCCLQTRFILKLKYWNEKRSNNNGHKSNIQYSTYSYSTSRTIILNHECLLVRLLTPVLCCKSRAEGKFGCDCDVVVVFSFSFFFLSLGTVRKKVRVRKDTTLWWKASTRERTRTHTYIQHTIAPKKQQLRKIRCCSSCCLSVYTLENTRSILTSF